MTLKLGLAQFNKGNTPDHDAPDYPLAAMPTEPCQFASPRVTTNYKPRTPEPNINVADLVAVIRTATEARDAWPADYANSWNLGNRPAKLFEAAQIYTAAGMAELVHMDKPTDLWQLLTDRLDQQGHHRAKAYNYRPFIEQTLGDADLASAVITAALDCCFDEKWYWGQARPEEIAGWNFTHYPEGSPNHCSYPAGHGTAAGATVALILNQWQLDAPVAAAVELAARQFAHSRTFAGVHFGVDNEVGYHLGKSIGQELLKNQ